MSCVHEYNRVARRDYGGIKPSDKYRRECKFPIYLKCRKCRHVIGKRCGNTKEERCKPCSRSAKRYRRLQAQEVLAESRKIIWYTLSGDGEDSLPWDKSLCTHPKSWHCSGEHGCRPEFVAMSLYNFQFKQNHNRFMEALKEKFPELELKYFKALETQERGVLHAHGFIVGNFSDDFDSEKFFEVARAIAIGWKFGSQQDWELIDNSQYHSRLAYLTKYITKRDKLAYTINPETGLIKRGAYHLITKSRSWGRSIKDIKQAEFERMRDIKLREQELEILENNLVWESAIQLLADVLSASPLAEHGRGANATPTLESTTKQFYGT